MPLASAEMTLPDGASITERDSTMSTYNSLEVWRTPGLRHGMAGPSAAGCVLGVGARDCFRVFDGPRAGEELLYSKNKNSHG